MDRAVASRLPGSLAPRHRDAGLLRIRRLTQAAVVTAVGGVAVLAGYVAHAVPGHHVATPTSQGSSPAPPSPASAPASPSSPSTGGSSSGASPSDPSSGPSNSPNLAAPSTPPRYGGYAPQVISGSS